MRAIVSVLCLVLISSAAFAEDKPVVAPDKNPALEAAKAFTKDLDDRDARHFDVLFSNQNMVLVVEEVRGTVGNTVEACGKENADLKTPLSERFDEWTAAVNPVIEEAEGNISNMILAQDYAKPKEIRKILKILERTRKDSKGEVQKVPVTSEKACKYLLKKMDRTQGKMVDLLRQTLISLPRAMQEEDAKARAKEKESPET